MALHIFTFGFIFLILSFGLSVLSSAAQVDVITNPPMLHGALGNVTWFEKCPGETNKGNVTQILLENCDSPNCNLRTGELLELVLEFYAGGSYTSLPYQIKLVNSQTSKSYILKEGLGGTPISPGMWVIMTVDFMINATVPPGADYYFQILRHGESGESDVEVCAVFKIGSVSPGTAPPTESTTEFARTTSNPNCREPGIFPDPRDCQLYHICELFPNGTIWDQEVHCPGETVYCDQIKQCEKEAICPCSLGRWW